MTAARRALPNGVGLGLRWEFLEEVLEGPACDVAFFELSPENYMRRGGHYPAALERVGRRYPLVTHGLTLSLGADEPLDAEYLSELADEVARLDVPFHSDHLAFTSSRGRAFHELMPLRFTRDRAARIAEKLERASARLDRPVAVENVTYYARPSARELSEGDFLHTLFEGSEAGLLLDVNNVYVNAQNHGFDARAMLESFPLERTVEIHVAGHTRLPSGLLLDNHGAPVRAEVLELLGCALERTGPVPVLLERDNDVPDLATLLAEVASVRAVYERSLADAEPGAPRGTATAPRVAALAPRATPAPDATPQSPSTTRVPSLEGPLRELVFDGPAGAERAEAWLARHGFPADELAAQARVLTSLETYRRLVRGTLERAVTLAMPRTRARLGELFDEFFERFLREQGPRTHYLRDVTTEFLDFCAPLWATDARVPRWAHELGRHEALSIVMSTLREALAPRTPGELELERALEFVEAARIVRYDHAVHRLSEDEADRTPPERRPTALFVYRDAEHDVRYLELSPVAASLLERLLAGTSLKTAVLGACEDAGLAPAAVLDGTAELLADLAARGALLGAKAAPASEPRANGAPAAMPRDADRLRSLEEAEKLADSRLTKGAS